MKHDLPNEWHLLKQNNLIDLTIDKSRLPYMVQTFDTTAIESVTFIAKSSTSPPLVTITTTSSSDANSLTKIRNGEKCRQGKVYGKNKIA
ncbi:MAG: hypothetical protein IPL67_10520 [Ignavibacteria bacterium]|nr:hypothetical protein [Ignavibacteria bacterium]